MGQPPAGSGGVRELYERAVAEYGNALKRLTRAYEADADRRQDVLQEIHLALWESLARFDGRCALGTWVYRVAHNTATSQVLRRKNRGATLVSLDELDTLDTPTDDDPQALVDEQRAMARLLRLIQRLQPLDRQIILLYLEGMDAASIGEITGVSARNVATKVHRIKSILKRRFHEPGGGDD
jgi:RNA polymerase sigma-70 factor (ECF subfamily)